MAHDRPGGSGDTAKPSLILDEEVEDALAELVLSTGPLTGALILRFHKVFPFIYRAHHRAVRRQGMLRGLSPAAAEDVMQSTFLKFFEVVPATEFPRFIPAFLRKIANGLILNHVRDERRDPVSLGMPSSGAEPPRTGPGAESVLARRQMAARLLRLLSDEHRAVIEMVDLLETEQAEAAEALGIPQPTLRSRLIKARLRLAELAREHFPSTRRPAP